MNESDPGPTSADSWLLIDQAGPLLAEMSESTLDVRHRVGDVMQTLTTSLQESPNRRVWARRLQELHERSPDGNHRLLNALFGHNLPIQGFSVVQLPIPVDGRIQVVDRNGNMVEVHEQHSGIVPVGTIGSWEP